MKNRFIFSLFILLVPFLAVWACASDNGETPLPTVQDSGTAKGKDAQSVETDDSGTPAKDAGVDCGDPTKPFLFGDGGVYCPFSASDGGRNVFCASGDQQCCVTPESAGSPSTCQDRGTDCPVANSTLFECQHPEDCDQGVCCAGAQVGKDVCNFFLKKFTGTKCRDACQAGELQVCGREKDCEDGQTCDGVKAKGSTLGICQ